MHLPGDPRWAAPDPGRKEDSILDDGQVRGVGLGQVPVAVEHEGSCDPCRARLVARQRAVDLREGFG